MIPANTPTSTPVLEETAPVAPPPVPVEEFPLEMHIAHQRGKVLIGFNKSIDALTMTPKVTRQLIRQLSKAALEADRYKPGQKA